MLFAVYTLQAQQNFIDTGAPGFYVSKSDTNGLVKFEVKNYYGNGSIIEKRIPDFRTTLLWSPEIISEEGQTTIQFYTSDRPGRYMVILQGMSTDGDLVSARTFFDIK